MAKQSFAERYGLDPTNPVQTLTNAIKHLVTLVESVKGATESQASLEKTARETMAEDSEASLKAEETVSSFRRLVFGEEGLLAVFPNAAVELHELLEDFRKDVRQWRDVQASILASELRPNVPTDISDAKDDAEKLKEVAENLYNYLLPMDMVPVEFPTKRTKAGNVLPDLPRIPPGPRSSDNVQTRSVTFYVDGAEIPAGVYRSEIARDYLSSPDKIVTGKNVTDAIKKAGEDYNKSGEITINDHTFTWKRGKDEAPTESEEATEEATEASESEEATE